MKRTVRTLHLGKETLLRLDESRLRAAGGGAAVSQMSQEGASCLQSCYFNTCGDTCVWPTAGGVAGLAGN